MAVSLQGFRDRYPEFGNIPDGQVQAALDDAALFVDQNRCGDSADLMVYSLAAHNLAIFNSKSKPSVSPSLPLTSRKVGDTSVSFGQSGAGNMTESFYSSTPYGQQYWMLVRLCGMGAVAAYLNPSKPVKLPS